MKLKNKLSKVKKNQCLLGVFLLLLLSATLLFGQAPITTPTQQVTNGNCLKIKVIVN